MQNHYIHSLSSGGGGASLKIIVKFQIEVKTLGSDTRLSGSGGVSLQSRISNFHFHLPSCELAPRPINKSCALQVK